MSYRHNFVVLFIFVALALGMVQYRDPVFRLSVRPSVHPSELTNWYLGG